MATTQLGLDLSLLVEDAKVAIASDVELFVTAIIDDNTQKTSNSSSVKPKWNEELHFNVRRVTSALKIELAINSSMRKQLLGFTTIPLYSIRHTSKHSKGNWKILHCRSVSGELIPTDHALRIDVHFRLPKDIPAEELKGLEEKLNSFTQILEEEAHVLQEQTMKIKMKELPPPLHGHGNYIYPNMARSQSVGVTQLSLPSSIRSSLSRSSSGDSELSMEKRSATWGSRTRFGKQQQTPKMRWMGAVAHPKFQEKVLEMMKQKRPNKGFNPAILELVSQLQGFEEGGARKRSRAYSGKQSVNAMNQIRSKFNRNRSKEQLQVAKHTIDEDMRIHVYKTALATLIYPVSNLHHHQFEEKSFKSPTYCRECEGFIYGMMKQGYQCKRCGKTCHKRCVASARPDCFHIKSTNASYAESLLTAITDVIKTILRDNESMFTLMREAFNVAEGESKALIDEVSQTVKHLARNFSANVSIKVLAVQGLATHKITDDMNLYVSVDVGGVKKRTKALKSFINPSWNEEFKFDCNNILEPIKIRVWNERHNTWGKLSHKFTTEGDSFLGQKTIEVMTLGAAQDLWYTLEKRTDDNVTSGSINLNVSCVVAGEFHVASYHQMYSLMHEQLFLYEHIKELNDIAPLKQKSQSKDNFELIFFDSEAQTILDRFATRYAIEPIFRIMVHTKLLADHSAYITDAYSGLINALEHIKTQLYTLAAVQNSILGSGMVKMLQEVFSASNFGKDNFSRCIDKLLTQLKVEMQQYRALYPADDRSRLKAFEDSCNLMRLALELQIQVMGKDPKQQNRNLSEVLKSCMAECITQTFDDIVQQIVPENFEGHPGLNKDEKPYEFFYTLLDGMESMEHEDRTIYQPLVEKYCTFVLGDMVALTVWDLFKNTIQDVFQVDEHLTIFPPMEAIHLLFTVKDYYMKHIYPAFPRGNIPDLDYPFWFKPAIIFWIEDFQIKTQEVIRNAWTIDKSSNFEPHNDQKFSSSSFDMVDYFLKGQLVIRKFDEDVLELRQCYNHAYAGVVKSTIVNYCDMISNEITNRTDLEVSSMLINNIQFLKHGVETIYNAMGGEEGAGDKCTEELKDLQSVLGRQVNSWCKYIGKSIKDSIWEGVQQVQLEIINVKSAGPLTKSDCKFDKILSVLFQYCKTFRDCCEERVILPKMINKIWVIVVQGLHNMLLPPMAGIAREDAEESLVTFVPHSYSTKQCNVVDKLLDYLKDFFQDDSLGVKAQTLVNNIKQLKVFTKLYGQTTDALISEFIKDFAAKACYNNSASSGEVSLEVSAYRHPATGEFDGSIRIISARELLGFNEIQVLKPHIELNLIVPGLENTTKYKYTASTKDTSHSPSFNQTFKFVLPPNNQCELAIVAKHKTMLGGSKVIGVAVVPLKTALQSDMHTIDLHYSLPLTDYGRVLLTILAQRPHDDKAKEFVELKTRSRTK